MRAKRQKKKNRKKIDLVFISFEKKLVDEYLGAKGGKIIPGSASYREQNSETSRAG